MRRVRIAPHGQPGALVRLSASEAHYIAHVLRKRVGDEIEAFDGVARSYRLRLTTVSASGVCGHIVAVQDTAVVATRLILGQAVPRGAKMDLVVEKCSELGLTTLVPLYTERTVTRAVPERWQSKLARWQRVAEAAARQCGRRTLLDVRAPMSLEGFCKAYGRAPLKIVCWAGETRRGLRHLLESLPNQEAAVFLVGPEGGWSDREIATACAHGFITVHLGPRILRTETAAIALTSILQWHLGALEPQTEG